MGARLLPHVGKAGMKFDAEMAWEAVLKCVVDEDDGVKTAAGACILEMVCDDWAAPDADVPCPTQDLADSLVQTLHAAIPKSSAVVALPLMLVMVKLLSLEDDSFAKTLFQ